MSAYPAAAPASNGSTHSAATSPAAAGPKVNDIQMVYHADIFLLALCFCFVLVSLPRAVARISAVDWRKGHFLRSTGDASATARGHQAALARSNTNVSELENKIDVGSDDLHTLTSHEYPVKDKAQASPNSPPHVPAFSTFLHPFSSILRRRATSGFSYGQALVLAIYSAVLGYLSLYRTNLISNPHRCD